MKNSLQNVSWYSDLLEFSFTKSLYTSLRYSGNTVTPAEIAGKSGFAFRIWVHKELCPSAMSVFDWKLLKVGAENCGYFITHITRLWDEEPFEFERRQLASQAIRQAIDNGVPAVVWDASIPEWELVTGYDDEKAEYTLLSFKGHITALPYEKLGRREIPILSVTIPEKPNGVSSEGSLYTALQMAVDHARQREWADRPDYENGLAAYALWAKAMDVVSPNDWQSRYYLQIYSSLRGYAADYLEASSGEHPGLTHAAQCYKEVRDLLRKALDLRNQPTFPTYSLVSEVKELILQAGEMERGGIECIEEFLKGKCI